jgi:DNA processing protein
VADAELRAWLRLVRLNISDASRARLLARHGAPGPALEAARLELSRSADFASAPDRESEHAAIAADLAWLAQPGRHLVTRGDPRYPPQLAEIADPPVALFVSGDPVLLSQPQIAIVGSRNPTAAGIELAREFAEALSHAGLSVTSGLAIGIDGAAHEGALAAGRPTIAVTACGPERTYPQRHRALADRIAAHGAVVTAFPTGSAPKRAHFPQRNRLISGLSLGTLVVEAVPKSGSLITAYHALEQNREVFAVPGSVRSPLSRGCHALIKQGAKLVENVDDILSELPGFDALPGPAPARVPAGTPHPLFAHLGFDPVTRDDLVRRSGRTASEIAAWLTELEIAGRIRAAPGGRYQRLR